jgi:hypothetical protein
LWSEAALQAEGPEFKFQYHQNFSFFKKKDLVIPFNFFPIVNEQMNFETLFKFSKIKYLKLNVSRKCVN